jgi:hypothetical protein
MSLKVEVILRNTYDDGRTEDHPMADVTLADQTEMIKVCYMLVAVADMIAQVTLEKVLGVKAEDD